MRQDEPKREKYRRHKATLESVNARIAAQEKEIRDYIEDVKKRLPRIGEAIDNIRSYSDQLTSQQRSDLNNAIELHGAVLNLRRVLEVFVFQDDVLHIPEIESVRVIGEKEAILDGILGQLAVFQENFSRLRKALQPLAEAYNELRPKKPEGENLSG